MIATLEKKINTATSLGGRLPGPLTRLIRYSIVGGSSTLLDIAFLIFFTEVVGIFYLLSALMAFIIANTLNYSINRPWNFKRTKRPIKSGYIIFLVIAFIDLLLVIGLLALLVEVFNIHYFLARIIVGIVVGIISYILNTKITFESSIFK